MTLFYALHVWLGWRGFGRDAGIHLVFWSLIAQAAAAGAVGGLAVGFACPARWSGPIVGVLAGVVGLVATAAGIVGMLGEILAQKYRPFNNLIFLGVLGSLLAVAGLTWCVGLVSR
jgi:hypothetical protein